MPEEEKKLLEREVQQVIDDYKVVMARRHKRESEIEDAYALKAPRRTIGDYPGASDLCSEKIMSVVDQAQARISNQILSVKPLMRVEPIDSAANRVMFQDSAAQMAKALERFLERYSRAVIKIEKRFPSFAHRFTKLGTAVVHSEWESVEELTYLEGQLVPKQEGRVRWTLLSNADTLIWPAWALDWQDDYEWVGHRSPQTVSQFKGFAASLGLDPALTAQIIATAAVPSKDDGFKQAEAAGIEVSSAGDEKLSGVVSNWEIWTRRRLDNGQLVKLKLFYNSDLRKILAVFLNQNRDGKHPYFPIRYKKIDQSAWGNGIGHELFQAFLADTAYLNIGMDNLMAAAFSLTLVRADSLAEPAMDRPYPGQRVATENPDEDVVIKSFAENGPTEMVYRAMAMNESRATAATGLADVLQGQGDPVLKSGGGTGSTIALIEQAQKKFGNIDAGIRLDLAPLYCHTLELIAQHGTIETVMEHTAMEDLQLLSQLFQIPPQASVEKMFQILVEAPSAANNRELQKQNALVVWNFILQTSQTVMGLAQQIFPGMNPAGLIPYLVQWANVLGDVGQEVIDLHEMPGMREILPEIPTEPSPEQQMINTLMQQLQQLQKAYEELQGQLSGGGEGGEPGVEGSSAPPPGAA